MRIKTSDEVNEEKGPQRVVLLDCSRLRVVMVRRMPSPLPGTVYLDQIWQLPYLDSLIIV